MKTNRNVHIIYYTRFKQRPEIQRSLIAALNIFRDDFSFLFVYFYCESTLVSEMERPVLKKKSYNTALSSF